MASETDGDAPSQQRTEEIIGELEAMWREWLTQPLELKPSQTIRSDAGITLTVALAGHTVELATAAAELIAGGRTLIALPLVRAAYETALTVQWLANTSDGVEAFINENTRQMQQYVKTLGQTTSETFRDAASGVSKRAEVPTLPSTATHAARRFDLICEDFEGGGKDAYAMYRAMSSLSHPSIVVSDQYLAARPEDDTIIVRGRANTSAPRSWLHIAASAVVWSLTAVDYLDARRAMRSSLRRTARELGIRRGWTVTEAVWKRENTPRPHSR